MDRVDCQGNSQAAVKIRAKEMNSGHCLSIQQSTRALKDMSLRDVV